LPGYFLAVELALGDWVALALLEASADGLADGAWLAGAF
jgi:hypothetical protein